MYYLLLIQQRVLSLNFMNNLKNYSVTIWNGCDLIIIVYLLLRLRAMKREMKVNELKVLDKARQRFLQYQQTAKEIEIQRLDDEIKRKVIIN